MYLIGVCLIGVYLIGVCLIGVYLMSVCLMGVYLMGVYLMGVPHGRVPHGVYLMGVPHGRVPHGVYLMGVYLMGVHLMGVHLMSVYLINVYLTGVYLMSVHLTGVQACRPHRACISEFRILKILVFGKSSLYPTVEKVILGGALDPRYEGTKYFLITGHVLITPAIGRVPYHVHALSVRSPMSLAIFPDDSRVPMLMTDANGENSTTPPTKQPASPARRIHPCPNTIPPKDVHCSSPGSW
jgi:hypothetical protein